MKIIFDHSTPAPLARFLVGHSVSFCNTLGWTEISNGELLTTAEATGFDVMVTCDQSIKYQQNLSKRRISLIVLGSNKWNSVVRRYVAETVASVNSSTPNSYVFIEMPVSWRKSRRQ